MLALGASLPIGPGYRAGLEAIFASGSYHEEENGVESDLGTLRTGSLMLGLDGPIATFFRWRAGVGALLYWPSEDTGIFLQGGTTRFLAGVGVDYRHPVMTKWDLMASARYDYHRFTTEELESRGLLPGSASEPGVSVRGACPGAAMSGLSPSCHDRRSPRWSRSACGDIGSPVRNDVYDWRLVVPTETGARTRCTFTGIGTICRCGCGSRRTKFRTCPRTCGRAIDIWEAAYLYGEFKGELVSDSNSAQVIVRGVPAPHQGQRPGSAGSSARSLRNVAARRTSTSRRT